MASISSLEGAAHPAFAPCYELLDVCLSGGVWTDDLLRRAIKVDDGRALISIVVEHLNDLFEPKLCDVYKRLFTEVIEQVAPELKPRLRQGGGSSAARPIPPERATRVYVLSRVTLGADIAVTSVFLDSAKKRYPDAEIVFVGPQKSYELFEADARVRHMPAPYARGGALADRLRASAALWFEDGIVMDPDSRLTQLGLISVCGESRYFRFPSRRFGYEQGGRLPELAAQWAQRVFGVEAAPYIAPRAVEGPAFDITVSLGVGENESKRTGDEFERQLLAVLAGAGRPVLIDKGGDARERERVGKALAAIPDATNVSTHDGAFAPFAAQIARSKLYVGYDSAGGHAASACGVPLISIAKGFLSARMAERWRPLGEVIPGDEHALGRVKELVRKAFP